jgi:hypothetical protein
MVAWRITAKIWTKKTGAPEIRGSRRVLNLLSITQKV